MSDEQEQTAGDRPEDADPTAITPVPDDTVHLQPFDPQPEPFPLGSPPTGIVFPAGPLTEPTLSTPLAEDEGESVIPEPLLWAMRDRQHNLVTKPGDERWLKRTTGEGDYQLYASDDGPEHYMIGRIVGRAGDGCVYCLVGRVRTEEFDAVADGSVPLGQAFDAAHDIALCSVYEDGVSNVVTVEEWGHVADVPADYLPGGPYITFTDDPGSGS